MEEDAGKLIHDEKYPLSYVDFNRSGVPLIEIVSEPDMRSPEEGAVYLRRLHEILVYLEICDGNMEEGSFRCDANVSIRPKGAEEFGTRTELKNMNSFRNVQRALEYEIVRQHEILKKGGSVVQETRLWDDYQGVTHSMRGKEEAHDYRYFPDPDLVDLSISEEWIEEIETTIPELPLEKRERFVEEYGIPPYDARVLTASHDLADFYEGVTATCKEPKIASNWVMGEFLGHLNKDKLDVSASPISSQALGQMINHINDGTISGKIAKEVFEEMWKRSPRAATVGLDVIIEEKGLKQMTDAGELEKIVDDVLKANPKQIEQYKAGKEQLFGYFVGQTMKATRGKANPQMVNEIMKKKLSEL